jgi:hypothetical protein
MDERNSTPYWSTRTQEGLKLRPASVEAAPVARWTEPGNAEANPKALCGLTRRRSASQELDSRLVLSADREINLGMGTSRQRRIIFMNDVGKNVHFSTFNSAAQLLIRQEDAPVRATPERNLSQHLVRRGFQLR